MTRSNWVRHTKLGLILASVLVVALVLVGLGSGVAAWIFLSGLELASVLWHAKREWFFAAPVVGVATVWAYSKVSVSCSRGSDWVVALLRAKSSPDQVTGKSREVPSSLAPLIVIFTWLSHVAGLSVGREGTAVQMGAGIAASIARRCKAILNNAKFDDLLLKAGVASAFGAVFGVPLAGAVFALEVGHMQKHEGHDRSFIQSLFGSFRFLAPDGSRPSFHLVMVHFAVCALVGLFADSVGLWLGTTHFTGSELSLENWLHALTSLAGASGLVLLTFGLAASAWIFLFSSARLRKLYFTIPVSPYIKIFVAGACIALFFYFVPGGDRYAGLGVELIHSSFTNLIDSHDFLVKILLTALCVGVGFKGGEVTPLLASGAALGAVLDRLLGFEQEHFLASLGMVGVFAVAARVPITCAVMAGEFFGLATGLVALPVLILANACVQRPRLYNEV